MALLDLVNRTCDEVGLPRPQSVVGTTDQLGRQMLALANTVLEDLGKLNWPVLTKAHEFTTVVNQREYALPEDYHRFATDTAFNADAYYQARGALTAHEWNRRQYERNASTGRMRYRIMGDPQMINILPTPTIEQKLVIEYYSVNLVRTADNQLRPRYTADSDTAIIPEELVRKGLKWRIKHAKGLDYSEDYNSYESSWRERFAQALNLGSVPVAKRSIADIPELGEPYVPDTGYGG